MVANRGLAQTLLCYLVCVPPGDPLWIAFCLGVEVACLAASTKMENDCNKAALREYLDCIRDCEQIE